MKFSRAFRSSMVSIGASFGVNTWWTRVMTSKVSLKRMVSPFFIFSVQTSWFVPLFPVKNTSHSRAAGVKTVLYMGSLICSAPFSLGKASSVQLSTLAKKRSASASSPFWKTPSSAGRQEASSADRETLLCSSGTRLARLLESEPMISSYSPSLSV